MRRLASWVLLAITVVLLVPREHWHELGHAEHVEEHVPAAMSVSASCAQCDTGWPVALAAEASTPEVRSFFYCPLPLEAVRGTALGFTPLTADRGPPAFC